MSGKVQLAIFIDGPKTGSTMWLPMGQPSFECLDSRVERRFRPWDDGLIPSITAFEMHTVTYRPAVMGIASAVGFWSIEPPEKAMNDLMRLVMPVLKTVRGAEEIVRQEDMKS
jgi:hypothetical protein